MFLNKIFCYNSRSMGPFYRSYSPSFFQFKDIAVNKKLMETLGLEQEMAKLNINDHTIRVSRRMRSG